MALTKIITDGITDDAVTSGKIPANAVGSSELADNAVDTDAIQDDAVTTNKIADNAVTFQQLSSNTVKTGNIEGGAIITDRIADQAVTLAKLEHGTSSNNGKFLRANNGADPSFETIAQPDLTNLSASNLTSGTIPDARLPATLPAISGANLTNLPAGGTPSNLVINGAMTLSQRSTLSTVSGLKTIDRFTCNWSGGGVTQEQKSEQSGTVFENGFSNYLRLTNTSNTSTDTDYRFIGTTLEAQDIANSGWNFKSASSYVTLSFWVRSSLAGTYYGWLNSRDGTAKTHTFSFTVSANTWTKVTKTISGNSGVEIHDNDEEGLIIHVIPWYGTYYTTSGHNLNAWQTSSSTDRTPDFAQNWANTSNATFDLTGVQLEVGNSASGFAFESYNETLLKCKRYCHVISHAGYSLLGIGMQYYSSYIFIDGGPIDMRATPTMVAKSGVSGAYVYEKLFGNSAQYIHQIALDGKTTRKHVVFNMSGDASRQGQAVRCAAHFAHMANNEPFIYLTAEI